MEKNIRVRFTYSNSTLLRCRRAGTPSSSADTDSLKVQSYFLSTSSFHATIWHERHRWEWHPSVEIFTFSQSSDFLSNTNLKLYLIGNFFSLWIWTRTGRLSTWYPCVALNGSKVNFSMALFRFSSSLLWCKSSHKPIVSAVCALMEKQVLI